MEDPHDLTARLKATSRAVLPDNVRATHLRNIREELEPSVEEVSDAWAAQRTLVLTAAALVLLLGSAATLVMANRSMPGDGLYGTKQAVEAVVGVVDTDYAASHRLDELEVYIERRAEPTVIMEAQARVTSSLEDLAEDDPLHHRRRQLVLGVDSIADPIEVGVDWDRGESFASSLDDGQLVFVDRRIDEDGSTRYEVSVTGPWEFSDYNGFWMLETTRSWTSDGEKPAVGILANSEGVTILTGMTDTGTDMPSTAAPTTTSPPPTTESAAKPPDSATTAADATTSIPPTTVAPVTATVPTSTATTTPTTAPTTTTTAKATTTTLKPAETTTTRPTTTTTAPTTTTAAPTTTTTAPTTTTTSPGDDDDD